MNAVDTTQSWRSRPRGRRPAAFVAALVVYIIVILVAAPMAQQAGFSPTGSPSSPVRDAVSGSDIDLLVGRSTVINVGATISRVSLTVPDIADALVTSPSQLLIHGKKPGTISLFIWDKGGAIKTFEVNVRHDLNALKEQLKQLFPAEDITVLASGKDVVLSGTVASKYVVEKAAEVAAGYVAKKEDVVNLLKQQEGVASNQVMLRVRFAEVSRSALTALGSNFFTGPGGFRDYIAQTSTQQFPQINYEELLRASEQGPDKWGGGRDTVVATGGKYTFSDLLNIMLFNNRYNVGVLIKALSEKGLFQSLAEPNLIATNGKEASFLAGGEYPYPVVQGGGNNASVTITFKEFGIRLNFTPTVLGGDLIHLKVRPEVSSLDFANAVTVEGFRVPALATRRTETEVELRDGQTFAIAGLMNNQLTDTMRKIPGIGDIPILGWLFKSKAIQKNQTELVVMITPTIIRKGSPGVSESLPSLVEPYLGRPDKTYPNPDPYTGSPRYPADRPKPNEGNSPVAQPRTSNEQAQPSADQQNAAVPSRPVPQSSMPAPMAPAPSPEPANLPEPVSAPQSVEPQPVQMPVEPAVVQPSGPTKEELRAIERAREQERKAAEAEARQHAEEEKARAEQARREAEARRVAERKAAEEKRQADRIAKERAKREAEIARKNAELARKKAEEDQKREKALNEAAERLKAAQDAYQMELEKAKGGAGSEKKESGTKGNSPAGR